MWISCKNFKRYFDVCFAFCSFKKHLPASQRDCHGCIIQNITFVGVSIAQDAGVHFIGFIVFVVFNLFACRDSMLLD
jgi:hypothetical protein